jgi:hypothetical protein
MSILKRIEDAKKLWAILMPHIQPPADGVLAAWITRFPESAVEAALIRGSKKFAPRKVTASLDTATVYKYIAGVVRNESEAQKEKEMTPEQKRKIDLTNVLISACIKRHDLGDVAGTYGPHILKTFEPTDDCEADADRFIAELEKAQKSAELVAALDITDPHDHYAAKAKEHVAALVNQ